MKTNSTTNLYGLRRSGVSHGDVFTSPRVVSFMLDLIGYVPTENLAEYRILEPSFGEGDFLLEIQNRLIQSAKLYRFDATAVMSENVYGCEIDEVKFEKCIRLLRESMPDYSPRRLKNEDFLFSEWDAQFDFIIGNPPYIRYENIPTDTRRRYKEKFRTFHYRSDLYVLFYEHCLNNLSENGRHCFICSNRWLKNEYGRKLRALIATAYNMECIVDLEKSDAFKESVLAYPAITVISNSEKNGLTKLACANTIEDLKLPLITISRAIKSRDNWDSLFWADGNDCLTTIEEQGFKIGIGVATGADKLFISAELSDLVEHELLLPIVNARDLTNNDFQWKGAYLLNPYLINGSIVDLNEFPKAKRYLEKHRAILENRHIVRNGRMWYSLIDKIKPQLAREPKILLPDISGNKMIFVDKGRFYPAHNIYYIAGKPVPELELLAAVLMSSFVKGQIENVSNKMNGGLPRWQSQSVKKIRIPVISNIPIQLSNMLSTAYHERDYMEINRLVDEIVKQQKSNSPSNKLRLSTQMLLDFDYTKNTGS